MQNDIVKVVREEFINEAKQSPILMNDLSHMEKYISESYDGRSLIELLQNADDAEATKLCIKKIDDNTFLIANNGRVFTREDLIALCRSGASTKRRKGGYIGFRGIGFKSVVNYSNIVHLISGNIKATFSRELTQKEIGNNIDVPLIRIPHDFCVVKYNNIINKFLSDGYNTIFIFETDKSLLEKEIDSFNNSCMLFLKHIEQIIFECENYKINSISRKSLENNCSLINVNTEKNIEQWLIYTHSNGIDSIAFKYANNNVIDSELNENYIHSFMPTNERFLINCKINGDFSTDPSRTKIILDDETFKSVDNISSLICKIIFDIYKSENDKYKLLPTISRMKKDYFSIFINKDINNYFFESLKNKFLNELYELEESDNVFIQPGWILKEDLKFLDEYNKGLIRFEKLEKLDGLEKILENFGIKHIDIIKLLQKSVEIEFSYNARVNIIKEIVKKYEYNIPNDIKEYVREANLFMGKNGIIKLKYVKDYKDLDDNMISELNELLLDSAKLRRFLTKFDIELETTNINNNSLNHIISISDKTTYSKKNVIKKWRSVEENVKLLLEEYKDIISVEDVSKRNIGYDIEVIYENGDKKYFEIKSVNDFGDTISITNNEYITAMKYPKEYNLLVVKQTDFKIEILIISNPIATLQLEKRIKSFEWICSSYTGVKLERQLD